MSKNKLGDVILDKKGSLISGPFGSEIGKKYFVKEGIPVIRGNNLSQDNQLFIDEGFVYITEQKAKELNSFAVCDDLIFTAAGTIGQVGIIPTDSKYKEYTISNKQIRARLDLKKVNPYYVYFWCNSPWINRFLKRHDTGSTVPLINLGVIKDIPLNKLELNTQNEIVNFLRKIDKKIETNSKINAELEKMAKTLYDYWFVQFDFPNDEGKPYRTSGGAMTYNPTLKREIPKNWEVKNILSEIDWETGAQPPKSEHITKYKNGYIRFIQNRDYQDSSKHITYIKISSTNSTCSRYDIMMDKYGNAGEVRYGIDGAFNVALAKITNTRENMQEYLRKYFESNVVFEYLHNACMASTRASLNGSTLSPLDIVIPKENLLKNFEKYNKQIINYILKNKQQNKQLAELRDFLLPLLMTGQVQVVEKPNNILKNLNQEYLYQKWRNKIIDEDLPAVARGGSLDEDTLREVFYAIHKNIKFN